MDWKSFANFRCWKRQILETLLPLVLPHQRQESTQERLRAENLFRQLYDTKSAVLPSDQQRLFPYPLEDLFNRYSSRQLLDHYHQLLPTVKRALSDSQHHSRPSVILPNLHVKLFFPFLYLLEDVVATRRTSGQTMF